MERKDLIKNINTSVNVLNDTLNKLGIDSINYSIDNGFTTIKKSVKLEKILNDIILGFFGKTKSAITLAFGLSDDYDITKFMPDEQLSYFNASIKYVIHELNWYDLGSLEDRKALYKIGVEAGKATLSKYKKETKHMPMTILKKQNSNERLKTLILETLKDVKSASKTELQEEIYLFSNDLKHQLVRQFEEEKEYGNIIGTVNGIFYGGTQKQVFSCLRASGIKFSESSLNDLMTEDQLAYKLTALIFVQKYAFKYQRKDRELYEQKVITIMEILLNEYKKQTKSDPYVDLLEYLKTIKNTKEATSKLVPSKKINYNLQRQIEAAESQNFYQLCLDDCFNNKTRTRKKED